MVTSEFDPISLKGDLVVRQRDGLHERNWFGNGSPGGQRSKSGDECQEDEQRILLHKCESIVMERGPSHKSRKPVVRGFKKVSLTHGLWRSARTLAVERAGVGIKIKIKIKEQE
jgi:hypothetical protein